MRQIEHYDARTDTKRWIPDTPMSFASFAYIARTAWDELRRALQLPAVGPRFEFEHADGRRHRGNFVGDSVMLPPDDRIVRLDEQRHSYFRINDTGWPEELEYWASRVAADRPGQAWGRLEIPASLYYAALLTSDVDNVSLRAIHMFGRFASDEPEDWYTRIDVLYSKAPAPAAVEPELAFEAVGPPRCPKCGAFCVVDAIRDVSVERILAPVDVECRCGWKGVTHLARRQQRAEGDVASDPGEIRRRHFTPAAEALAKPIDPEIVRAYERLA